MELESHNFFCVFASLDIITAGSALGYAGEWEAFQNYRKTSCNASDFGQVRSSCFFPL